VAIPVSTPPARAAAATPARRRRRRRPQRIVPIVVLVVLLVAAGTAAFAATAATGPRVRVPNFVGAGKAAAEKTAKDARVGVRSREVPSDDPAGTVIGQDPAPGTLLGAHRAVTLRLSKGPPPVDLPVVESETEASARAALEAAGFVVSTERRTDENVPAGHVADQSPGSGQAPPGSEIHLVISDGPRPVEVPNVVGKSYDDAARALTAKRFKVTRQDEYSDTVVAGRVIRHDPVSGAEAARDSTVTVVVSRGPDLVTVGDYGGETVEDAVLLLEEAGLQVDVVGYRPGRRVKHQDPPEGTKVRRNETVTLYL
jgi:serine/threonine-protein kinase